MKTTLRKFIVILSLAVIGLASMPARANLPEAELPAKDSAEITRQKLDIEKQITLNQQDAVKMMVHDLAWNSWVLFAVAAVWFGHLKARMRHETIRQMVDKGVPITPEVLQELKSRLRSGTRSSYDRHGYLFWGVILLAVGIGVLMVSGKAGWIVLLIGVAELILWAVDQASQKNG